MGSYGATGSAIANEGALARLIFNRSRLVEQMRKSAKRQRVALGPKPRDHAPAQSETKE
jgi:hypothetical protein